MSNEEDLKKFYNQELGFKKWDDVSLDQKIHLSKSLWFAKWQLYEAFKCLKDSILRSFNK